VRPATASRQGRVWQADPTASLRRARMRRLLLPLLGLVLALALAGCGQQNRKLIPQTNASALSSTADRIARACAAHDRVAAQAAVRAAGDQISALPGRVDTRLRDRLRRWVQHIHGRLSRDCKKAATPTPTPIAARTPTPTATSTPTLTPTHTPTPTPT
jgi:hypothetical protein